MQLSNCELSAGFYAERFGQVYDDDTALWGQSTNDFKDGMYGGMGGEPRDESVMVFLPDPRIVGVRASYKF